MKYFKVYFRIKSAYQGYSGFENDEQSKAFHAEVAATFASDNWEITPGQSGCYSDTAKKEKQELYLHPMNFSGVIREDNIEHLRILLSADTLQSFHCYHVDLYNEYKDMTDDEYLSLLHTREQEIETALLTSCQTKRKNLYAVGDVVGMVSDKFSVPRLGQRDGLDEEHIVVREVFNRLTRTGAIEVSQTKYGEGYRTTARIKA